MAASPRGPFAAIRSAISTAREDLRGRHDGVDQPDLIGAGGVDELSAQGHLEGDGQRDPGADLGAPTGREEPALDLRQAEAGLTGGDDHVAPEQQLEPTGHRGRVGRPHHRHADPSPEEAQVCVRRLAGARSRYVPAGEGPQIHARGERALTGSGEDDGPDVRGGLGLEDGGPEIGEQPRGQGVARLGAVEPEDLDGALALAYELGGRLAHER